VNEHTKVGVCPVLLSRSGPSYGPFTLVAGPDLAHPTERELEGVQVAGAAELQVGVAQDERGPRRQPDVFEVHVVT
jgi:hypothetical protein